MIVGTSQVTATTTVQTMSTMSTQVYQPSASLSSEDMGSSHETGTTHYSPAQISSMESSMASLLSSEDMGSSHETGTTHYSPTQISSLESSMANLLSSEDMGSSHETGTTHYSPTQISSMESSMASLLSPEDMGSSHETGTTHYSPTQISSMESSMASLLSSEDMGSSRETGTTHYSPTQISSLESSMANLLSSEDMGSSHETGTTHYSPTQISSLESSLASLVYAGSQLPPPLSSVAATPSSSLGGLFHHLKTDSIFGTFDASTFAITLDQSSSSLQTPTLDSASPSTSIIDSVSHSSLFNVLRSTSHAPLLTDDVSAISMSTNFTMIALPVTYTVTTHCTSIPVSTQSFSDNGQSTVAPNTISGSYPLYISSSLSTSTPAPVLSSTSTCSILSNTISNSVQVATSDVPSLSLSVINVTQSTKHVLFSTSSTTNMGSIIIPILRPHSVPTPMPASIHPTYPIGNVRCQKALLQFPERIEFDESTPAGTRLAASKLVANITLTVTVVQPPELTLILSGYFNISTTSNEYILLLDKQLDVEDVYIKTGRLVPIRDFELQIECSEIHVHTPTPAPTVRTIHVTVNDVDDNLPEFVHQGTSAGCVVPVYTANAGEDFTGELDVTPGRISAVDGDLFAKHSISYSVMHAEPENYDVYFNVDVTSGSVNKTKTMNASDPRKYVIFVQAMEDSPQQKKRVAVLSIEVFAPTDAVPDPDTAVNPAVKLYLKVASGIVILGFTAGFIVILHHRYRRKLVNPQTQAPRELKLPPLAFSEASCTLDTGIPKSPIDDYDIEQIIITSPSQIEVKRKHSVTSGRSVNVKRPVDVKVRPAWNATSAKTRRVE